MPEGPLGGPRPGAEPFQGLQLGLLKQMPEEEAVGVQEQMENVFGTAKVNVTSTPDIEGSMVDLPLKTETVYLNDIEDLLSQTNSEYISDNLWSVEARVRGKEGAIRPWADAKQRVTINYTRIPQEAMRFEEELEQVLYESLTEGGPSEFSPGEIGSIDADLMAQKVIITLDKNSIDNSAMNTIEYNAGNLPAKFNNMVLEGIDDYWEASDLGGDLRDVEPRQITIEAI